MVHLVSLAVNPNLSLRQCWQNWYQISMDLREPLQKRLLQLDNGLLTLLSSFCHKFISSNSVS
jgi:hypothetical protein